MASSVIYQSVKWLNVEEHEPQNLVTYWVYAEAIEEHMVKEDGSKGEYFLAYHTGKKQWSDFNDEPAWWVVNEDEEIESQRGMKVKYFAELPDLESVLRREI